MKIHTTLWYAMLLLFACHTSVLPVKLNRTKKHLLSLIIGIGSKAILDHLIQECVNPLIDTSSDPADQSLKREVAEELAKALSINIIHKSAETLLNTLTPDEAEMLCADFATGMEFTTAKNLAFTSGELSAQLAVPDPEDFIQPTSPLYLNKLAVYPPREQTTAIDCGPQDKLCTASFKLEEIGFLDDNNLMLFIQSIAPFAGIYFTKLSFEIGTVIAQLIKKGLPLKQSSPLVTHIVEALAQAGFTTFLFEQAKIAFRNIVQSILASPEKYEESIQKLMRLGEKYLIVTETLAPHYQKFLEAMTTA